MNISEQVTDGALILSASGRLDSMTSASFEQLLMSRIDAGQIKLVIDFSDLSYISSAGLRVLLIVAQRLKTESGAFALCVPGDRIRDVLEISGFLSILTVVDNQEAAIAALNA